MREEHNIQTQISTFLKWNNILHFSVPNGIHFNAMDKARASKYMKYLKDEGFLHGTCDLVLIFKDNVYFVEVKTEKGKLSDYQKEFQQELEKLNHNYLVWRSLTDCEKFIREVKK